MYLPRYAEKVVQEISQGFKFLYVGGARQVGKTTLLKHLSQKERQTVSFLARLVSSLMAGSGSVARAVL